MEKRGFLILLMILISITLVKAVTTNKEIYLEKGDSIEVDGKKITLDAISGNTILVDVDGEKGVISEPKTINGVYFRIIESFGNAISMNISINFTCGDGTCANNENKVVCCKDCKCNTGFVCKNNRCVAEGIECNNNAECDDDNKCTIESCNLTTKKCAYQNIIECKDNDDCCASNCDISNDDDCRGCKNDKCLLNNSCYAVGSVNNSTYCDDGDWFGLRGINASCKANYECLNNNCINNTCKIVVSQNQTVVNNISDIDKKTETGLGKYFYYITGIIVIIIIIALVLLIRKKEGNVNIDVKFKETKVNDNNQNKKVN